MAVVIIDNPFNYYGKYRGIVTANNDPKKLAHVQASVPDVMGDKVTAWALPCIPCTGNGSGKYVISALGAGVWIEFEARDPDHSFYCGDWWAERQLPSNKDGEIATHQLMIIRTNTGMMILLNDRDQIVTLSDWNGSYHISGEQPD